MPGFIVFTGKKDDEMDPMDPSAYSDAPRYILTTMVTANHQHQLGGGKN